MIVRLFKRFVLAILLIYAYDVFSVSLGISIPINFTTILLVSFFGVPALVCLVLLSMTF